MNENEIAKIVVDAAIEVHRGLGGPGLLEAVYEEALAFELESRGLSVVRQKAVPLVYKGKRLASDLRLDLLVGERVIVECKATVAYNGAFEAQALTYLRLSNLKLAIVINFGEVRVRQGIHRVVNGLQE
ncbi:GxxExxY protein [Sorangium sp. So ce861]|uniref:GxxExxY protein n=1 Tax=Sorangium sp. So ce861 TaxID=3133323 RepID=UPI003F5D8330